MQRQVGDLRKEIARYLEREDADELVAEEAERGTAKGRSFEELVHDTIERDRPAQGDAARTRAMRAGRRVRRQEGRHRRRDRRGARRAARRRIVFEAKNKRLSKNDAWTELNACMGPARRGFAVLVVAGEDKVPAGLEELTEYQGNKIIAVLDREDPDPLALRLVYRYVRARVLAAGARPARGGRRRRPRRGRGGGGRLKRAQPSAQVADQRHQQRQRPPATSSTRWWPTSSAARRIEGLVAAAARERRAGARAGREQVVLRALALGTDDELRARARDVSAAETCSRPARG